MGCHKQVLLIDLDDFRRQTRVQMLKRAGYDVQVRRDSLASQELNHEDEFDLVVLALHSHDTRQALAYADKISLRLPQLSILIVSDTGVFVPPGLRSDSIASGDPAALMEKISSIMGFSDLKVLSSRSSTAP